MNHRSLSDAFINCQAEFEHFHCDSRSTLNEFLAEDTRNAKERGGPHRNHRPGSFLECRQTEVVALERGEQQFDNDLSASTSPSHSCESQAT